MTQSLNSTFTVFILLATITRLFPKLLLQACVVLLWASWPLALHTLVRIHGTCQIISIIEKVDQLAQSFNFPVSPKWEEWVMLELIVPLTTDLPPLPSPHSNLLISFSPVPWLYALLTDLFVLIPTTTAAAAAVAAKLLQSCLTLCDPIDGSLPGSPIPGIL